MNWENLLTGISAGSFDSLRVRDNNGSMQNILTLLGNISGVSDVQASAPLSVVTNGAVRTLSIDLSAYSTSSQVATAIAAAFVDRTSLSFKHGANASVSLSIQQATKLFWGSKEVLNTDHLYPYFTGAQTALILTAYPTTIVMNAALLLKQDVLTAGTNVTLTGTTLSVTNLGSGVQI